VAINPDTGKMAWYSKASPQDTHDWDSTQVLCCSTTDQSENAQLSGLRAQTDILTGDRATGKKILLSRT